MFIVTDEVNDHPRKKRILTHCCRLAALSSFEAGGAGTDHLGAERAPVFIVKKKDILLILRGRPHIKKQ